MRFLCNHCDQKLHTKHYWEGMSILCPSCGKSTELKYRTGQSIPEIGYSITFRELRQLLTDEAYSKDIDPIVEKLLNCSVDRSGSRVRLAAEDGSLIPMEIAHLEIQSNSDSQRVMYGAAMDQWR